MGASHRASARVPGADLNLEGVATEKRSVERHRDGIALFGAACDGGPGEGSWLRVDCGCTSARQSEADMDLVARVDGTLQRGSGTGSRQPEPKCLTCWPRQSSGGMTRAFRKRVCLNSALKTAPGRQTRAAHHVDRGAGIVGAGIGAPVSADLLAARLGPTAFGVVVRRPGSWAAAFMIAVQTRNRIVQVVCLRQERVRHGWVWQNAVGAWENDHGRVFQRLVLWQALLEQLRCS